MEKSNVAQQVEYNKILNSPVGVRFYNAILSNSPRVWASKAQDASYCEQLHKNLAVTIDGSSRFIEYTTWVKLANMTEGSHISSNSTLEGLLFDTKQVKRSPHFNENGSDLDKVRSPCGNVDCNCTTHMYEPSSGSSQKNDTIQQQRPKRSPKKVALFAVLITVVLVVVITAPIIATRHKKHDDFDDSQWETSSH